MYYARPYSGPFLDAILFTRIEMQYATRSRVPAAGRGTVPVLAFYLSIYPSRNERSFVEA